MDTTRIQHLIGRVLIKTMKRTKREGRKLPGSSHSSTLMWPQMLRNFLYITRQTLPQGQKVKQNLQ